MPLHAQAWQAALKPLKLRVRRWSIYQWEGESGVVTARRLLSQTSRTPSKRAVAALLSEKERCLSLLARRINVQPDFAAFIARAAHRKIPLGLVTGTSAREVRRVAPKTVLSKFDVVVTGDRVRRGKPHPEPYQTAFR